MEGIGVPKWQDLALAALCGLVSGGGIYAYVVIMTRLLE